MSEETTRPNRTVTLRLFLLCVALICMLLSDCYSQFGAWIADLKLVGIALVGVVCVASAGSDGIPRSRLFLGLIALALLIICIPFQTGSFSLIESLALYVAVFGLACLSGSLIKSWQQLLVVALVALTVVVVLMIIGQDLSARQWSFYVGVGRPRIKGPFSNPNSLGHTATMIGVMFFAALQAEDLRASLRAVAGLGLVGSVVLLWFSDSRTAMGVLAAFALFSIVLGLVRHSEQTGVRVLLFVVLVLGVWGTWALISNDLTTDASFSLRWEALMKIRVENLQSFVGIGYITSKDISQLTTVANGATDMLYVSLFYRAGIIGYLSYLLFVAAAAAGAGTSRAGRDMAIAVIVALALQAMGESYLSSVMSFASVLDWVLLACLPTIARESEERMLAERDAAASMSASRMRVRRLVEGADAS